MKTELLVILLLVIPFIGFVINRFIGNKIGKILPGVIATVAVAVSFVISLGFFIQILGTHEPIHVHLFEWVRFGKFPINFDFTLDQLSLIWLLVITGVGALIHIYSIGYMHHDENKGNFFAYLNLFIFFMLILVTAGGLPVMFIGWEGVGLCSYLLIGFWYKNQQFNNAAKKAFIMNRIGDLGFLIGIFILAYLFHSVDFETIKASVTTMNHPETSCWLGVATFMLFVGAMGKSAQIPLYTWLPDAMAGPTPVSALIHAATMVTAGIFMVTRLNFLFNLTPHVQYFIAIIGVVTSLFAATIGIAQTDIKKVLAYSTVSQLGLMFLALGTGAYAVAVFHVITHAFFKACLFLGSGSVIHGLDGEQDMRKMGALRKYMPITYVTFLIASLSISGIPPFAGFFSKDEILMSAFSNHLWLWIVASVACLLTSVYIFRALFLTFNKSYRGKLDEKHIHESPATMTFPLVVLAILAFLAGVIGLPGTVSWLDRFLHPVFAGQTVYTAEPLNGMEIGLMVVSVVVALIGLAIAYVRYIAKNEVPAEDDQMRGVAKVLYHKYYIDEIYACLFVKPFYVLSSFFIGYTEKLIDFVLKSIASIASLLSCPARKLQNGSVGLYLFCFVLGFCVLVICLVLVI